MANVFFNNAKEQILNGGVDLLTDTIKVVLVDSTYSPNPDDVFVDDGTANDVTSHEISVTGYTPGFGGAGRKTLAGKSVAQDDTDDEGVFDANDLTWTTLGAGATIGGAVLIKEVTADNDSLVLMFFDTNNVATNGGDVTLAFDVEGLLNI